MSRKILTAGVSLCVASTGLLMASPSQANIAAATGSMITPTHFALGASGYSTRVKGGAVPLNSGKTAFQVIGCTNKAGLSKMNAEANLNATPLLDVQAASTRVWTTSRNGVVASNARNHIVKVVLGSSSLAPTINGITSTSRAYHNRTGFHASARTSVLYIDTNGSLPGGRIPGPTRGNPVSVLGITIAVGPRTTSHSRRGAMAEADALRITLPTGTKVFLAHSRATINRGVKSALFGGSAFGTKANLVNGTLKSGPTPLIVMPCQGTNGHVRSRSIVSTDPFLNVHARALTVSERAAATRSSASAYEQAHIARVNLGHTLVIAGINAKATVTRDSSGLHRSARGTSVARVRFHGSRLIIPANGVLRIRGIALIETKLVHRIKGGIAVIAARVTLLDARAAVVTLGSARVKITPSGF